MIIKRHNLLGRPENIVLDFFLLAIILYSIIGLLAIKGATNLCFFILFTFSVLCIKRSVRSLKNKNQMTNVWPVIITLALPVIAVAFSQFGRQDWLIRSYDGPSRMLFSIPIFLFFLYKKVNFSYLIGLAAPIAIWLIALSMYLHPEIIDREGGRFATTFVRPNSFGTYTTVLTGFCLFHLDGSLKSSKLWFFYQLAGILVGLYLILGSSTRGSWLAIPFIIGIWLLFNYRKINIKFFCFIGLVLTIFFVTVSYFSPIVEGRLSIGFNQVVNWFNHSNLDTSPGIRLSIWKISWQLFLHEPLLGYGDNGYKDFLNKPWFDSTATESAKSVISCCGAHNELLSNLIRSGIFGGISIISLFLIPFVIFSKNAYHFKPEIARASHLGLAYLSSLAICSINIEVLHLKYMSSFYGLIISGLIAQLASNNPQIKRKIYK